MIVFTLLRFLWPFLLLGAAYFWAQNWCNDACHDQTQRADIAQGKLDELDRQRIAQDERWAQVTAAEELRARRDATDRAKRFAAVRAGVPRDSRSASVRVPDAGRVFGDAYAAAEPARSPSPPKDTPTPDPSAAEVNRWAVDMYEWAAVCRDRVTNWEAWYQQLRETK